MQAKNTHFESKTYNRAAKEKSSQLPQFVTPTLTEILYFLQQKIAAREHIMQKKW